MAGQEQEVKKVVGIESGKKAAVVCIKTRFGNFIGEEEIDESGSIVAIKDCVEIIQLVGQAGLGFVGHYLGTLIEFPEDYMLLELTPKAPYYQEYIRVKTGLVSSSKIMH